MPTIPLTCPIAVSYTHLDVYKRQTHTLASDYYIQTWAYGRYGYGTALALVLTLLVTVVGIIEVLAGRKKEDSIS